MAIKIDSVQKGYYKAKIGDVILTNRTTERKAKDDGINYCLEHNLDSYTILFPDLVEVSLDGLDEPTEPEPPIDEEPIDEEPPIDEPPIDEEPKTSSYYTLIDPLAEGIVEGVIDEAQSILNKASLNKLILDVKADGFDGLEIGAIDAYFFSGEELTDVNTRRSLAIRIPSDFHLKMSDDTYLRQQPHEKGESIFMSIHKSTNVKITGGNMLGDRYEHDYITNFPNRASHENNVMLVVGGSQNVIIDNVSIKDATGDCFVAGSSGGLRYKEGTVYNQNIIIRNCTFDGARRNNISLTDGDGIIVENCSIINAGLGEQPQAYLDGLEPPTSAGVLPRCGLDIEPFLGWDKETESVVYYERVENVIVRGNDFTNNAWTAFTQYSGEHVLVENNTGDNSFGCAYGHDTKFINNTIIANPEIARGNGLTDGSSSLFEFRGNTVSGFNTAMVFNGSEGIVTGNTLTCTNGTTIRVDGAHNYLIEDNDCSGGLISAYQSEGSVTFKNNRVMGVFNRPISCILSNTTQKAIDNNYTLIFDGNTFEATATEGAYSFFDNVNDNTVIKNNTFINHDIYAQNCNPIQINNTINGVLVP